MHDRERQAELAGHHVGSRHGERQDDAAEALHQQHSKPDCLDGRLPLRSRWGLPIETNPASADCTRPFTGKEFLESLRDGREIWIYERVDLAVR